MCNEAKSNGACKVVSDSVQAVVIKSVKVVSARAGWLSLTAPDVTSDLQEAADNLRRTARRNYNTLTVGQNEDRVGG